MSRLKADIFSICLIKNFVKSHKMSAHLEFGQLLLPREKMFSECCLNDLKFCKVSQNPTSNRCRKFQLSAEINDTLYESPAFLPLLVLKWPFVGQPSNFIYWATSMPMASISSDLKALNFKNCAKLENWILVDRKNLSKSSSKNSSKKIVNKIRQKICQKFRQNFVKKFVKQSNTKNSP